ncbi:MAG: PAS domain S-box protein [Candidatus Omnitrophota bacterium]
MKDKNQSEESKIKIDLESLEYSNNIIATLREPFLVLDKNLRIISSNQSFYATFKVAEKDTIGQLFPDLGNRQWNIPKLLQLLKEILPEKKVVKNYEVEHKFEHIGERVMIVNACQLRIPKKIAAIIAAGVKEEELILLSIEDITERRKAEREEIVSLARFPSENPLPVLRIAEDGMILYSNEKGLKILAGWGIKVGSKAPERWCCLVKERFDAGKTWQEEEEEEGKIFSVVIAPIKGAGYANLYFQDITERKKTEEQIKHVAAEWRVIFDAITDLILITDMNFKIIRVNKAFANAFNLEPKEIIGKLCYELIHGAKEPPPDCPSKEAQLNRKKAQTEFFDPRLNKYLEVSISPIFNDKGNSTGLVQFIRDISGRKMMAEEAQKHLLELEVFYKAGVGREGRILELKEEANKLCEELGKPKPY